MLLTSLAAALALQAAPAAPAPITQEQRALLRCSAAFALVANGQAKGDAGAKQWPPLATRGREFFVRALAQLMDETALDREGIAALAAAEARALQDKDELAKVMPSCLLILEGSGV